MNRQQSRPVASRKRKPSPDDALKAMGLTGISRAMGLSADASLAVVASVLTALAGPDAWIESRCGHRRLLKLDLLTDEGDFRIQRWIDHVVSPLEIMQRQLVSKMGRLSPQALEMLACGAFSSATTAKQATSDVRDATLRRHMDALATPSHLCGSARLLIDLADDPTTQRMEAVLHPQFVIKRGDGINLKSMVDECHLRSALIIHPKLGLDRKNSEPTKVMKILIDLLDGATVTKRPASIERGRDSSLLAKAQAILALTSGEIEALNAMAPDHMNRFLWLKGASRQASKPGLVIDCQMFNEVLQQTLIEILELRRAGKRLLMNFEDKRVGDKFADELETYEVEFEETTCNAGPWARGLPQAFFWALGFLCRSMPPELRPSEESLMSAAFATARRLVKNHNDQVLSIKNAKLLADCCKLAGKIVEDVASATSPMKFRDIARCNHVQTKEKISPVVNALIEIGVLVRDEDGFHALGPLDLEDAAEILVQMFVQP